MAARRLIIVLLVLMAISTIAAVLAPPIEERRAETPTGQEVPADRDGPTAGAAGELVEERVDASARPATIAASAGDRLSLTVVSPTPTNVQIPGLGLSSFADRGAPAYFDVALREQATYRLEHDDGALIATIEVGPARAEGNGDSTGTGETELSEPGEPAGGAEPAEPIG